MKKLLTFYLCCVALFVSRKAHPTSEKIYEKEFNINTDIPMSPKKFATSEPATPVNSEIKVFPNPTNGNLTVFIPELPDGTTVFQLFDVMGHNILSSPLTGNYSKINLSAFSQGIYYYRIMNDGVSIGNGKVVKQ